MSGRRHGPRPGARGGPAELSWKVTANALYGVLASPHFPTQNVVAANVVTATARALAFALQQSLNGIQVVTDGCSFRADQVPAGTFADCLAAHPGYPIDRAGVSVPFLPPGDVPDGGPALTAWYRGHVQRFFGVSGPEYGELFGLHDLELHQFGAGGAAFDALACDGGGNHAALRRTRDGWEAVEFKARGYGPKAKDGLLPWLIRAYAADEYTVPPVVSDRTLLSLDRAREVAGAALGRLPPGPHGEPPAVWFPLGAEHRAFVAPKVIKPSGFLFRTPAQRRNFLRAWERFAAATGCGIEFLALRRGAAGRRRGSLRDVALAVHGAIRRGGVNFTQALNLNRLTDEQAALAGGRLRILRDRREAEAERHARDFAASGMTPEARLAGLFVTPADLWAV